VDHVERPGADLHRGVRRHDRAVLHLGQQPVLVFRLEQRRRPVSCIPISRDRYGRTVATSSVGAADLGAWLVQNGLALDWPQYSKGKYGSDQRAAELAGRGMWKGSYVEPWLYRVCIRASGTPGRCSDDASPHPDEQHVGKPDR
jgi:Staphylococcal nuclease homologue